MSFFPRTVPADYMNRFPKNLRFINYGIRRNWIAEHQDGYQVDLYIYNDRIEDTPSEFNHLKGMHMNSFWAQPGWISLVKSSCAEYAAIPYKEGVCQV